MEWIKVEDHLPESGKEVLIAIKDIRFESAQPVFVQPGYYWELFDGWVTEKGYKFAPKTRVVAWMPFPDPPEDEV